MSEPITSTLPIEGTGTLLGIWAHPDDEAFLSAGLMASAVRAGQRVAVVTATAGELGTADPERWPPGKLGALRRREMTASLAAVGVTEHTWLDYPDGGCAAIPDDIAIAEIADVIAAVAPDTIVTFGPDGMTGHPDHQVVSRWATAAWIATRPTARLWYATLLPSFHERWGALNDELGLFAPDEPPPCTDDEHAAAVVVCDGTLLDAKMAALDAHASQTRTLRAMVGDVAYREWFRIEAFADASDTSLRASELIGAASDVLVGARA
jgi:LmbE family N-acetylglucosaminyl deacetylase